MKRDSDGNPVNSYGYDESKWKHDGNDGIAFYYKDGKYYAYSNHTVEVTDLSSVSGLARYTNAEGTERNLMMVVLPAPSISIRAMRIRIIVSKYGAATAKVR